jgi:hypothetical protein
MMGSLPCTPRARLVSIASIDLLLPLASRLIVHHHAGKTHSAPTTLPSNSWRGFLPKIRHALYFDVRTLKPFEAVANTVVAMVDDTLDTA